jgi:salicylate hydroxylase
MPGQPCGTQAVPLAIEDAAALGALFARCRSRADVPGLLSAFGDVRQPRGEAMLASEREKLAFLTLPRGPAQAARDAGFRAAMAAAVQLEDVEDEAIAREAEDFVRQWAYDAYEAVDDWWTQWGAIRFPPDGEDTRTRVFWNTQVEST